MRTSSWKKTLASVTVIAASIIYAISLHFGDTAEFSATNPGAPGGATPNPAPNPASNQAAGSAPISQPAPAQSAGAAPAPAPAPAPKPAGQYADGTYVGTPADAYYGTVQVKAVVSGGKIADVTFLQYPNTHSTSVMINSQAMPYLKSEAIQAQNANVDIVSGATDTSLAFQQSLASALSQAKN